MRRLRTAVAVLTVATLAASAAACSSSKSGGGTSADAPQTVLIWDTGLLGKTNDNGSAKSDSFLHQAASNFHATHKNITIKIVEQGGDISANAAQFKAASIAGNGPDIHIQYTGGPTLSFSKYFVDLSEVLGKDTLSQFNGLNTVRKNYEPSGSLLALPYGSGTYFTVWYNKKLLKQAGLDPDYQPTSWQDLISEGQKYHTATGKPAFYVADLEGYVGAWVVAALAAGNLGSTAFTDQYSGKTKINTPAMQQAYTTWSNFFKTGLINKDAGEVSNGDADQGFIQGKAPIYFSGTWGDVGMYQKFKDNVGWSFIPMEQDAKFSDVAAGGPQVAISVTNYSKHQAAAEEFVKYLAEPKTQDLYVKLGQTEGSSNKQGDTSVIKNPLLKQQAEKLKTTQTIVYPFDNVMPQSVIDLYYRLDASTFLGKTTPQSAVQQLQAALDAEQG
ncbi:ABC transporter substrate-binding protein [Microlunatus endophyticus]|uniref:ABC transporter substrate-binding protein n=1 Tax=Microlunatus endophyticus TaxID=1716077 RepID=A0A917W7Q7_9ACTN|nr:ABC transporter substrate-binding protein [Microlunatus endophyticus]